MKENKQSSYFSDRLLKIKIFYTPLIKYLKVLNNLIKTQQVPNPSSNNTLYIFLDLLSDFLIVELDSFVCKLKSHIIEKNIMVLKMI